MLLGHTTVCAVEIEPYCRRVLLQRQRDGILPKFPIWDDVCTFDGKPWRGKVDVVCGGFPCQDISVGNRYAQGIEGDRSGLWKEFARIIGEVRPEYCFVENSPAITTRGLGRVLGDLAQMGYDAEWGVLGADSIGCVHHRARFWLVANTNSIRLERRMLGNKKGYWKNKNGFNAPLHQKHIKAYLSQPDLLGSSHGFPYRMDRVKAIGNAQVAGVARNSFIELSKRLTNNKTQQ